MTDCSERFRELTHRKDVVLDEDLVGLQRRPDRTRIERYNNLKSDEEEFRWEFSQECSEFLTGRETDRVRGQFKLARLMLVASFYADGEVPQALEDEFVEAELQAVVDFDRYKQFDALSESQIEEKIRRMDGEVYELVTEYTSTQIAKMDRMLENPEVQRDVMERLLDRYDDRREKIRRGFFTYVETHGLEHMVEAIEDAVKAVTDAAEEREQVREERREEFAALTETLDDRFHRRQRELELEVRSAEGQLVGKAVSSNEVRAELSSLRERTEEFDDTRREALDELNERTERVAKMEERLETKVDELERARERAANAERPRATEEVRELVESELANLESERDDLRGEIERLQSERERIEIAREQLHERQADLESRVEEIEASVPADRGKLPGEDLVTTSIARLFELDYLGRFDISMQDTRTIHTPDGAFDVVDGYWDGRSERRSERPRLGELLNDGEDPSGYPSNQRARYEITRPQYLGLGRELRMVVEAVVYSHMEAYATNGFDTRPADLDDLLGLVDEALYEAENEEYTHLLAIASPTGWTDRVTERIESEGISRTRYSQYVSVCLIDLQSQSVVYDDSDPVVEENIELFEPSIDAERVEACVEYVRRTYVEDPTQQSVTTSDVTGEDFDGHIVKRAFDRLETEGIGEQLYVGDVGLALHLE
jgi:hypothetical protein